MKKSVQGKKNAKLSEQLATYIINNPKSTKGFPERVTFIAFSPDDEKLNKENERLVESVKKEDTTVVKAQKTNNPKKPWNFTFA